MILCVLHAYNQLFSFIQLQFYVKFHHYLLFNHRVIRSNIHAYRVSIEQSQERKQTLTDNGHDQICTGHALSRIGDRAIAELEELPSFPPMAFRAAPLEHHADYFVARDHANSSWSAALIVVANTT